MRQRIGDVLFLLATAGSVWALFDLFKHVDQIKAMWLY